MGDRHAQSLTCFGLGSKGRVGTFDAHVSPPASKLEAIILEECAREKAGLTENLKAVANTEDETTGLGEGRNPFHHRGESGDGTGSKVVAVRKTTRKDQTIDRRYVVGAVPDVLDSLTKNTTKNVKRITVAIGTGEYDNAESQQSTPHGFPRNILPRALGLV